MVQPAVLSSGFVRDNTEKAMLLISYSDLAFRVDDRRGYFSYLSLGTGFGSVAFPSVLRCFVDLFH